MALPPGRLYFHGEIGPAALHAHRVVQVLAAFPEPVTLRGADGTGHEFSTAIIPSGALHAITGPPARGLLALIEPSSAVGRALTADRSGDPSTWRAATVSATVDDRLPLAETVDDIIGRLTGTTLPEPADRHPALTAAMEIITAALPARLRIGEVARGVHLSESRLAHLFAEQLGLPFRAHVRWERIRLALSLLASGESLSQVAHAAGFTDSAHLGNSFRAMFGSPPSDLVRGVVWEGQQVPASRPPPPPQTLEA
ncbi:AraC family transcriptional regulator [Phytomonospora sp. NPDC050363]|uniref:helix-turn-helix transcriptional regulator n=1 Tax=Phytomonospora sp. NPDC050363 TaxID=3155642 RepID=UPI0033F940C6